MKFYSKFSFWLTALAVGICLFNLLGYDDKSLLLFFTSPPFWMVETHWFVINFTHPSNIPIGIIYAATILFWLILGFILDKLIKKMKSKGIDSYK